MLSEFIGEKNLVDSIQSMISKFSSSVFLFYGHEGVGKKTLASIMSNNLLNTKRSIVKENQNYSLTDLTFKNTKNYNLFKNRSHPDLFFLESEEKKIISIDQIRLLKKFLNTTPSISDYKVVIIDSINQLSINGLNMMLKSLEEPPENTFIFLISHNSSKIIDTVNSRLFKFYFKTLNKVDFLKVIYQNDLINIPEQELINLGAFFNFSPGMCKKYFNEKFFSNYNKIISFFNKIIQYPDKYHIYEFDNFFENNKDLEIKILFINRVIKNFLIYSISNQYSENILKEELYLLESSNGNKLYNNLYKNFIKFENDLFYAEELNVNKNDVIDNYLRSFNF